MTSLRFVLGLLIMAAATRADTMGVFVTTQFQGVVGVSLAAMVLMRRQENPFGGERAETGGRRPERGERRAKGEGGKADLRPKTASGLPKRTAPWMTRRMRERVAAQQAAD